MKHLFTKLLLCIGLISASAIAFAGGNQYSIKVHVNGVKDSACYLANYYGDKQYLKDTAKSDKSGHFVFEGKETLPGGIYLVVIPGKRYFEIIINKEQNFSVETDTVDFIKNMKVKGSEENELFYQYLNFMGKKQEEGEPLRKEIEANKGNKAKQEEARKKITAIDADIKAYRNKILTEHSNSFLAKIFNTMWEPEVPEAPILPNGKKDSTFAYRYYKSHYFDKIDFTDDRILRTPIFHSKLDNYFKNLVVQIPDSINKEADAIVAKARANKELFKYVVWYVTYNYETSNIMGMDAVFVHMVENYYTGKQAYWMDSTQLFKITDRAKSIKPLLLGKKAQPIILEDTSGTYRSLYDLKTKYTVIVFWDPDCGHCQKAMPKIVAAYDSIKTRGGEVFAVDGAVEEDKWKKFIRDHKLKWINVADIHLHNNFRAEWDLKSFPQIYIIDENKEIIARKIGPEQIVDFLDKFNEIEKRRKSKS